MVGSACMVVARCCRYKIEKIEFAGANEFRAPLVFPITLMPHVWCYSECCPTNEYAVTSKFHTFVEIKLNIPLMLITVVHANILLLRWKTRDAWHHTPPFHMRPCTNQKRFSYFHFPFVQWSNFKRLHSPYCFRCCIAAEHRVTVLSETTGATEENENKSPYKMYNNRIDWLLRCIHKMKYRNCILRRGTVWVSVGKSGAIFGN